MFDVVDSHVIINHHCLILHISTKTWMIYFSQYIIISQVYWLFIVKKLVVKTMKIPCSMSTNLSS